MKNKAIMATAVATAIGGVTTADVADAATYTATLNSLLVYSNNGTQGSPSNVSSTTGTWTYDDVTNLLTQDAGGQLNQRVTTAPTSTLYRVFITGLVMGNGGAASATSYTCQEGNFGGNVGASICGNYSFGANFASDSTTSWGPGTAASRTLGGDDTAAGPQQTIAGLNGMNTVSFVGTTLVLANKTCTGACPGTFPAGAFNGGQQWTFTATPNAVVPIPATAWLLGTGLMGLAGRRYLRKKA